MADRAAIAAGVIGLGEIGLGVAESLSRSGMLAAVYDIREDAGQASALPAMSASPAGLAAACDVVLVAVVTAAQVEAVLAGPDGIIAGGRPDTVVLLLSTLGLDDLDRIRAIVEGAGLRLVDCAVTGGPLAARSNGLVCLVGAEDALLERVRPVLESFARSIAHMGGPGAGMRTKIVRNAISVGCLRAGREGARLATALGVDLSRLTEVVAASSNPEIGPMMFAGRTGDPGSDPAEHAYRESVRAMMIKDLDAALAVARAHRLDTPLLDLARATTREIVGTD